MGITGLMAICSHSPSRTCLCAHGRGLQDVGATGDAAVANHIYSVADSIDNLGELVKRAPRPVELTPAMIGHHDGGRADVHGTLCVRMMPLRQNCLPGGLDEYLRRLDESDVASLFRDSSTVYPLLLSPRR